MQKVILQVDWSSENKKKKAIKMVSQNEEVESFIVDGENKRLTVVGNMDPVRLVLKMRKHFPATDIVYMESETPAAVETQQREPSAPPSNWPPYHPYPYQFYPANGPSYHPYPSNWPPSGGYYG